VRARRELQCWAEHLVEGSCYRCPTAVPPCCIPGGTALLETRPTRLVCRDLWLECARRAFAGLDADSDGRLSVESLIGALRDKLPAAEVDYAVEDALLEAGYAGEKQHCAQWKNWG
jgi:hypothetical protein